MVQVMDKDYEDAVKVIFKLAVSNTYFADIDLEDLLIRLKSAKNAYGAHDGTR